jgi:hypothetical protein
MPITSRNQKLSKIETLGLARNYIEALGDILHRNESMEPQQMAQTLSQGLSQGTSNLISGFLQPRTIYNNDDVQQISEISHNNDLSNNKAGTQYAFFEPNKFLQEYNNSIPNHHPQSFISTIPTLTFQHVVDTSTYWSSTNTNELKESNQNIWSYPQNY